ncbi:MAG: hypothetical protein A2885_10760 [Sphingopyxis sp. RIFCSPHIGHO2_01_FULL_65_24]|nr:MAG: hypothetical protein A2885_10760 [Sphingopyxis sp. RIFCSPHIGHO2_01_FULL_65_24]
MRHSIKALIYASAAVAGTMAFAAPASAQATKTWISGVGDDANPCSRTAPCKTFAGAISKTAASGEISCLDPGGFGAVTITKAITIECDTTTAAILVSAGNGINVNAGVSDIVIISGIDFEGFGQGGRAVNILQAGGVVVRNSTVRGFRGGATGNAINFAPANAGSSLTVENVTMTANNGGIVVVPANGGLATVSVNNVRITGNTDSGVFIQPVNAGTTVKATVSNSLLADTGTAVGATTSGNSIQLLVKDNVITGNSNGVVVAGSSLSSQLVGNRIAGNGIAIAAASGANLQSYGDNVIVANTTNGSFTGSVVKQ